MPTIKVDIQIDDDVLIALKEAIKQSPSIVNTAFERALSRKRIKQNMLDDIRNAPEKPKYPIRWKTERQRRAFFATDGFGKGIPYQRTGGLQRSWRVTTRTTTAAGVLALETDVKSAIYVQGDYAQPFHLDSGWPQVSDVVAKYDPILTDTLIDVWYSVLG